MICASCSATIDTGDRFCPACRMPNLAGSHHPRFGPPEREPAPMIAPRVVAPGHRPCPRCAGGVRASDHWCRSCGFDVSDLAPLPPEGRTVGVWTRPGPPGVDWYRSSSLITVMMRGMLTGVAACAVGVAVVSLIIARDLHGSLPLVGSPSSSPDWQLLHTWSATLAAVQLTFIGLAAVLIIGWTYRTYRNLRALEVVGLRMRTRWAVLGWLIPGVNLVVPKRIIDDTWRASDPDADPWSTAWRGSPVPAANTLWMVPSLVALPVVVLVQIQLSLISTLPPDPASSARAVAILYLALVFAEVLLVLGAGALARVVDSVSERQDARVRVLGPPAPLRWEQDLVAEEADEAEVGASSLPVQPVLVHSSSASAIGRY
jgi:Domain of unknown function (DUF4328)